jgi:hypothetical protein
MAHAWADGFGMGRVPACCSRARLRASYTLSINAASMASPSRSGKIWLTMV